VYIFPSYINAEVKSKALPVTGRRGLYGCGMLRTPHCLVSPLTDGAVISLTRWPLSVPQKHFLMLIYVIGCQLQRHIAAEDIKQIKKFKDLIGNRARDLPDCNLVPQSATLSRGPQNSYLIGTRARDFRLAA
jgi:hypothetical protein